MQRLPIKTLQAQVCVVGGGLAGLAAAVSASRHGVRTVLVQDRPMLGGNASSEIRMWICGARGRDMREAGLLEEWLLENQYRNPDRNYFVWDSVLWGAAMAEENLTLVLNCAVCDGETEEGRLVSVKGYQSTTQTWWKILADIFIDCSGDSVLAPLTGASCVQGREGRSDFGESVAPPMADRKTMGMSCLIQARQETTPQTFIPPAWAKRYTAENPPNRISDLDNPGDNFWYLELGGEQDCITDTEEIRDELLRTAYGLWDFLKNAPGYRERNRNWRLDFVGILPGKRETRRYRGQYVMTQRDIEEGGCFEDVIAYGGWTMDDHPPGGFLTKEAPTVQHPAPSPFGIPYRCLVSREVENLMFAGRNISVTHVALSATRVMGTCAMLGQAAGTAAALACSLGKSPADLEAEEIRILQQQLLADDCWLPGVSRQLPRLTLRARLTGEAEGVEAVRNGIDRSLNGEDNGAWLPLGKPLTYSLDVPAYVEEVRLVFDSDLNRDTVSEKDKRLNRNMLANRPLDWPDMALPPVMTRAYELWWQDEAGRWRLFVRETNNRGRLRRHGLRRLAQGVRLIPLAACGAEACHLFAFEISGEGSYALSS